VVEQMKRLVALRGAPESITTDYGGEFAERATEARAYRAEVQMDFIGPGRPVQNGYIEGFNGRLRDESLNGEVFFNLADARKKIARWRSDYNQNRPPSALADRTPAEFVSAAECRPFVFPIVNKADPQSCPGFAGAGPRPPPLGTTAVLPSESNMKTKGIPEPSILMERITCGTLGHRRPKTRGCGSH